MQLYENKFVKALDYLNSPSMLNPTGDKPICYVVYDVKDASIIQDMIPNGFKSRAEHYGFNIHVFSVGEKINQYIKNHEYYEIWKDDSIEEEDLFDSIRTEIDDKQFIEASLLEFQSSLLSANEKPLILIKDLELLHPFHKIGAIENRIYNRIELPMLILYPGNAQGTARTFLNIYNMDGNYRSKNF